MPKCRYNKLEVEGIKNAYDVDVAGRWGFD